MEANEIKNIIEAVLFAADHPVTVKAVRSLLGEICNGQDVNTLIQEIAAGYAERNSPVELLFIAGGWQMATKKEFAPWIKKMYREKATLKLSPSALETLAVVAYKQPITRAEIEAVRGVDVAGVLDTILERRLVKIVGRKETIGRPLLYGTTNEFLRHFGLSHLSELPSLEELAPPELPLAADVPDAAAADDQAAEPGTEEAPAETAATAEQCAGGHAADNLNDDETAAEAASSEGASEPGIPATEDGEAPDSVTGGVAAVDAGESVPADNGAEEPAADDLMPASEHTDSSAESSASLGEESRKADENAATDDPAFPEDAGSGDSNPVQDGNGLVEDGAETPEDKTSPATGEGSAQ